MPIIRKKLAPSQVYPDDIRYNEATDTVQSNINGVWVDNPAADPRNQTTFPPRITGDTTCDAAQSVVDALQNQLSSTITAVDNASTAFTIAGLILGLFSFGVFAIFISIALFIADQMIAAGSTALEAALTPAVFDQLKCILYCHMDSQGRVVNSAELTLIKSDVENQIGGLGATILNAMLSLAGVGGINNLASLGTASGDCSTCGCAEPCNDKWNIQFGTLLGTFDGYLRVESVVDSGRSTITLITDSSNDCCTLLDCRVLEPVGVDPFLLGVHINCGDPQTFPFLQFSLGLGGCYNYVGTRLADTDTRTYVVEFLFADCP